jgi:hypothetical protein
MVIAMLRLNAVRLGLVVLVASTVLFMPARPAQARSTWEKDGNVITITVNAAVIGADSANKAAFIAEVFELYYPPGGFQVSCFTVVFELDIVSSDRRLAGRHSIFVVPMDPSDPWVAEAQVLSRPSQGSGRAYVSEWDTGPTLIHELSHLMGLPDEYGEYDANGNGRRDPTEPTYPDPRKAPEYAWNDNAPADDLIQPNEVSLKPGATGSLMASNFGRILDRHALELLKKTVPEDQLKCEWEGSGSIHETPLKDDHRELTRSAEFEFTFDVDPEGNVEGDITLTYDARLTVEDLPRVNVGIASFDPEVGGEVTDPNPRRTFPLTGSLANDFLTLEFATPVDRRPSIEFTIRADPGVGAGLGGVPVRGDRGEVLVIRIQMVPFSPFGAPGEVESDPRGPRSASTTEEGDNYRLEWEAKFVGDR